LLVGAIVGTETQGNKKALVIKGLFTQLAEKEGFEPSMGVKAHTPLAGEPLRPLGHLSGFVDIDGQAFTKFRSLADCTHFGKP
jgi:hypothetical protein